MRYGTKAQGKITTAKGWDCNKAIKETRTIVSVYKKITADLVRKLHSSKELLNNQKKNICALSWADFCEQIGMDRKTADAWLRLYDPFELSKAGKTKKAKS
ncbi:MAG: hypothetical protein FWC12_11650 [Treponema sp.]|nr:hypothetical protein [Treponema sp.]